MKQRILLLAAVGLLVWVGWSDYSQHGTLQPGRAIDSKYLAGQAFVSKQMDLVSEYYAEQAEQSTEATPPIPASNPTATLVPTSNLSPTPQPPTSQPTELPTESLTPAPTATPQPTKVPTATARPTKAPAALAGPTLVAESISLLAHDLVNKERGSNGLGELMYDEALAEIARKHSEDMAQNGYFAHDNLMGESFSDRYARGGYLCANRQGMVIYGGAENIHQGWRFGRTTYSGERIINREWHNELKIAQFAVVGWMNSPGHRANILNGVYNREGIGVAFAPDGKLFITQNFC